MGKGFKKLGFGADKSAEQCVYVENNKMGVDVYKY